MPAKFEEKTPIPQSRTGKRHRLCDGAKNPVQRWRTAWHRLNEGSFGLLAGVLTGAVLRSEFQASKELCIECHNNGR